MQKIATLFYKVIWKILNYIRFVINHFITILILYCNNVQFKNIYTNGIPYVVVARGGNCVIGNNFKINNNIRSNPIGRVQRCILFINHGASLSIGKNVGMSSTAIVVNHYIQIGDFVKIGGGVCIYDTDFHSLDAEIRKSPKLDSVMGEKKSVIIGDNVFIGAHSTLLKGVTIGKNSIIGACSVVTKNIPPNEIWAGNPARFIKRI